ncbi:MAG: hypothetical protein V1702_06530 [Candidatus Woesearchaeota archaeon]
MADKLEWIARGIGIIYAIFLTALALNEFGSGSFLQQIGSFLLHMIPAFIVLAFLLVSWQWNLAGGICFIALGLFYIAVMFDSGWVNCLVMSVPPIAAGIIFIVAARISRLLLDS